jgi:hypothetical protein
MRSYDPRMPVWRCPHCSTPQAETARCWVCRRSTTSCATCRNFRRGVASGLGMCGLDPRRVALTGVEMRACWAAPDPVEEAVPGRTGVQLTGHAGDGGTRRPRTFVPVDELTAAPPPEPPPVVAPAPAARPSIAWSLWGDQEP